MSLKIVLNGGYADKHQISLNDMSILSKSVQNISKYHEIKHGKTKFTDVYITATKEGSYELLLELWNNNPAIQVIGGGLLYDLAKEIKNFIIYTDKKEYIKSLVDDIYTLSMELDAEDSYDYIFEEKKELLEEKEKRLNAEFATYSSIQDISKLVKSSKDEISNKPDSISFTTEKEGIKEKFSFDSESHKKIVEIANKEIEVSNITVRGIPSKVSRGKNSYFSMKVQFFGKLKIYVEDIDLDEIAECFKIKEQIKITLKPLLKMGELIKTREGKLIKIHKEDK